MQRCKETVWAVASRWSRHPAGLTLVRPPAVVLLAVASPALPSLRDAAGVNAAYTSYSRALLSPSETQSLGWLAQHAGLPVSRQASLLKARVALAAGHPSTAIAELDMTVQLRHGDALTEFLLGQSYAAMHDMPDAIAHWRAAHAAGYFVLRGLALRHQKDWAGAERALLIAADIKPDSADTEALLAQFYREWGKSERARPYLVRVIELNTGASGRPA